MKKKAFILIVFALVLVISNSCKKSCVCYTDNTPGMYRSMTDVTTQTECSKLLENEPERVALGYTRCEWEMW